MSLTSHHGFSLTTKLTLDDSNPTEYPTSAFFLAPKLPLHYVLREQTN